MSNQVYIPPINFNENENNNSSTVSINAVEPLEYNKLNSNLSIKAATENNYGVITTGTQTFKGLKTFSDNLTVYTGSVLTDPTNDTDITNKKYVDTKTTDLVKYNTSTKYLIDNKTNSNINNLRVNNLSIDNQINGSSVSVSVSTSGYHGTDTKNITVYKGYVNGMTCIIFNKNTEINSYHWVSEIAMNENGIVMDFSNFSDIYGSLPQMFELKGEVSTYGGNKHIATKTLKFVKSSGYKYTVQYDKSYPMNLFKLKDSIKDTDTYIFTSETNKIGTLTIDKGYLYNSPTENNNLVNKSYVDTKDGEIISLLNSNVSTLNGNIDNAKIELRENITSAISGINTISLSSGTLETVRNNNNSLTNKNYVDNQISKAELEIKNTIKDTKTEINNSIDSKADELNTSINNAKAEMNAKIISSINGISNVDLTTGTISTTPTNDTDIANKKFVTDQVNSGNGNVIRYNKESFEVLDSDNVPFNLLKFNCFVQIDNDLKTSAISSSSIISNEIQAKTNLGSENLTANTSTITTLNTGNITNTGKVDTFQLSANASVLANLTVNDTINFSDKILSVLTCDANIENYQGEVLTTCKVNVLRIKLNANTYYIKLSFNFAPFTTVEKTFPTYYIRYIDIPLSGTSQSFDINYFYKEKQNETVYAGNLNVGRCLMSFYNGRVAFNVNKYVVQLGNTEASRSIKNNCEIFTIPDITLIYTES